METSGTPPHEPGPEDETRRVEPPVGYPTGPGVHFNLPQGARLPLPGNAEWALWFVVEIVFAIIWAASDAVDAGSFVQVTAIVTFAYLISRGIAKASRVLEQ
jgi:hypothetical protein